MLEVLCDLESVSEYMSVKEAAAALEVSENTVRKLYDDGRVSGMKTPGGHRRILKAEVLRLSTTLKSERWGINYPPKE